MKQKHFSIAFAMFMFCFALLFAQDNKLLTVKDAMQMDKQGNHDEAIELVKQIISKNPETENSQAHMSLGMIYFRDGQYDNAIEEFGKAIAIKKKSPMAYYFLGLLYEKKALGTPDTAETQLMKRKALVSWQNYTICVDSSNIRPDGHENIDVTVSEAIRRAGKHIEILKGGLRNENK